LIRSGALFLTAALLWFASEQTDMPERKIMVPSVEPERRAGETFLSARMAGILCDAEVFWEAKKQEARLVRGEHTLRFRLNKRQVLLNGRKALLKTVPFLKQDSLMIPMEVVAKTLRIPLSLDKQVHSLLIKSNKDTSLQVVPLPSHRTGMVLYTPRAGDACIRTVRLHGQARAVQGYLIARLVNEQGETITEQKVEGLSARYFQEFRVDLLYATGELEARKLRVITTLYTQNTPRQTVTIPILFRTGDGKPRLKKQASCGRKCRVASGSLRKEGGCASSRVLPPDLPRKQGRKLRCRPSASRGGNRRYTLWRVLPCVQGGTALLFLPACGEGRGGVGLYRMPAQKNYVGKISMRSERGSSPLCWRRKKRSVLKNAAPCA
jgi:hypothetical protein